MIYLDNAATSYPTPPEVIRAVRGVMEKIGGNPGRSGHSGALAGGRILETCRELAAQYAGVPSPERVIFCLNCTDALNMALRGTLRVGDEVIVSHAEHNAVMRPLMGLHEQISQRRTCCEYDSAFCEQFSVYAGEIKHHNHHEKNDECVSEIFRSDQYQDRSRKQN